MAADENPQPTTGETRLVCEVLRVAYEDLRSSDRYRRWDAQRFWLNARQVAELACMVAAATGVSIVSRCLAATSASLSAVT
jgi:hypothetical protein